MAGPLRTTVSIFGAAHDGGVNLDGLSSVPNIDIDWRRSTGAVKPLVSRALSSLPVHAPDR